MAAPAPLVRVVRGRRVESCHLGSLVVVEGETLREARGDPERVAYYRSTSKPLQALPLLTTGAARALGLTAEEIALASGSHSGTAEHVAVARSILAKARLDESALRCGGHWSTNAEAAAWQRATASEPLAVFSNCSGKHAGMLAVARHLGADPARYLEPGHPVQRVILTLVSRFAGVPEPEVVVAIDGCGAPTFGVSVLAMARSMARLGDPAGLPDSEAEAARAVVAAMREHPEMVAGRHRFDTDLIRASGGRVVAKAGAEGVHGLCVPDLGLGMAVKVEDGSDRGYRIAVVERLVGLGALGRNEAEDLLDRHAPRVLANWAGTPVGRLEAVLE
jgi:L-asparaginase II